MPLPFSAFIVIISGGTCAVTGDREVAEMIFVIHQVQVVVGSTCQ
jgi:hypothetical protein